jgi:hypothetical protein
MLHGPDVPAFERGGILPCLLVQRREHDVELLEDVVGEIETAVGQDVDFASMEDGNVGILLAKRRDLLALSLDAVDRQRPRRRVE